MATGRFERTKAHTEVGAAGSPPDPLDTPLPCDITVGHGTMRKGVKLRTLVHRMKVLYQLATGFNADEMASRTLQERQAALARITDPAGAPKLQLTAMEALALDACNLVKAWAESDRSSPFPEEAHALCDGVLMFAAQRRRGVQ